MKILCVEDDTGLAQLLQQLLTKQHYQVDIATDGETGRDLIETYTYDLILLDWMLPQLSGIEICRQLRADRSITDTPNQDIPILLMTASDSVTNRIMGLDAGADDYVVKPFDVDELLARVRALLRRNQKARSPLLQWGNLQLNPNNCEVTYNGQSVPLAAKEYQLLELFLRHPDQIFSLDRLLTSLWVLDDIPSEGAVRSHIKGLRQKLRRAGADDPIKTIYKLGYRLKHSPHQDPIGQPDPLDDQPLTAKFDPLAETIPPLLWDVWQEYRQSYCDRLEVIEQAILALQKETLTPEQQQAAEREAHTIAGSLGSFGLEDASRLSRQIQQILSQEPPLSQALSDLLSRLVESIRRCIMPPKGATVQISSDTAASFKRPFQDGRSVLKPILLVVDNDVLLAQELAKEASSWGMYTNIATAIQEAQDFIESTPVDAILLDLNFADSTSSGLDFLAILHHHYPDLPVVILTAEEGLESRVMAARLGSRCFLQKPIAPSQVLASVMQVLPQPPSLPTRILVVDDDPALLDLLKMMLEPHGYDVILLKSPDQFWRSLEQTVPDLLILDVELKGPIYPHYEMDAKPAPLTGIELCQVIRNDPRWNRLPVLFLSAHTDIDTVQRGFAAGADDFLTKPVIPQDLLTRVRTRLHQRRLWGATDLDELTGVSLRRKALQDLTRLIRLAQRQHQPFTLALLDLDHFKEVNDEYGHDVGDQVLSYLGKLLRQSFREEDIVGRWGGEEFIIGMYGITEQDGKERLDHALAQLRNHVFFLPDGETFRVTFSAGIARLAETSTEFDELKDLYHSVDQALYEAKAAGRNRIIIAKIDNGGSQRRLDLPPP